MDLTAQVLHDVEFREAKRGGYNTQDVDEFLERLAVAVDRMDAQLREARQRVAAAESRLTDADRRVEDAEVRAAIGGSEADETLKRTLVLAQRTADAAIREAEERAARTIATAEDEAARMVAEAQDASAQAYAEAEEEARRAQHAARTRVLAELQELEAAREMLRADVELLEHHIELQRDRLRVSIRDLTTIVEDPSALREAALPALHDVVIPEPEPEPQPVVRPARQLVAEPVDGEEDWDDPTWAEAPDADAFEPVQMETPPSRTGPRSSRDEARLDQRPLLAEARRIGTSDGHEDVDEGRGDDAYLAELRKAMADDEPLGPRDDPEGGGYEDAPGGGRSRFGRRR